MGNLKYEKNTVLYTKDGRKIGNALIVDVQAYCYLIKTDYGNVCRMTEEELAESFYIVVPNLNEEMQDYYNENIKTHKHYQEGEFEYPVTEKWIESIEVVEGKDNVTDPDWLNKKLVDFKKGKNG